MADGNKQDRQKPRGRSWQMIARPLGVMTGMNKAHTHHRSTMG